MGGLLDASFPRTRESRFGLAQLAWIPAFASMTEPVDPFVKTLPLRVFRNEDTKVRTIKVPNFVLFVSFVVNKT